MQSLGAKTLGLICLVLGQLAAAIPENLETRLIGGVCSPYGNYLQSGTGNGFVGNIRISPAGTGTYIDGLDTGLGGIVVQQRGANPYYYLGIYNSSGYAAYGVQCFDEDGFTVRSDAHPIRISTDNNRDALLVYQSYGLIPEPHAHYIDGVKQDGVYLGIAGKTTWAFSQVTTPNGATLWKPRLLLGREDALFGDDVRSGEIVGFLTAKAN